MSKEIELDVITNYNTLDTVIEKLIKLRDEHGGKSMVDTEVAYYPYEVRGYVRVCLIVSE